MMNGNPVRTLLAFGIAGIIGLHWADARAQPSLSSFAFVQQDGTLRLSGYTVHLYGIFIPPTEQICYTFVRPISCNTRAALALNFKISGDFVRCAPMATNVDGSITANCSSGDTALSEWMLQSGWAIALPDAPIQYVALERIARSKGVGIWGIPVDGLGRR